jgi:selenium metabolism protein YedF
MSHQTLDCLGLPCPQPVLRTKEALDQGARTVTVLVDNEASQQNVLRFARSQGHRAETATLDHGRFSITVTAVAGAAREPFDAAGYSCATTPPPGLVYVISSDSMGRGSDDLGWALLQTYIQTIKDVQPLPARILFYNSGVKLVTAASGALGALVQLQELGVEILVCGTCLDFFQLKSAIQVGHISNMHEIMSAMAEAGRLVSPY